MCAMLSLILPKELKIAKSRVARFIEAYIGQSVTHPVVLALLMDFYRYLKSTAFVHMCRIYPQVCDCRRSSHHNFCKVPPP